MFINIGVYLVPRKAGRLIAARNGHEYSPLVPIEDPSSAWAHNFINRHSDVLHTAPTRVLEPERAAVTYEALSAYYDMVNEEVIKTGTPPELIANFDETMLEVNVKGAKAITLRGSNVAYVSKFDVGEHISLGVCIFADGSSIPPTVILPMKTLSTATDELILRHFHFAGQENGWMTQSIFCDWVKGVFIPQVNKRRKKAELRGKTAVLLADGHCSRASAEALKLLREANIKLITPPAHSTHITAPLDVVFFGSFKSALSGIHTLLSTTTAAERREKLLLKTLDSFEVAARTLVVLESFERAGIWPFNKEKALSLPVAPSPDVNPLVDPPPKPKTKKAPAKRLNINNKVLTISETIAACEKANLEAEERKQRKAANQLKRLRKNQEEKDGKAKARKTPPSKKRKKK